MAVAIGAALGLLGGVAGIGPAAWIAVPVGIGGAIGASTLRVVAQARFMRPVDPLTIAGQDRLSVPRIARCAVVCSRPRIRIWTPTNYDSPLGACAVETEVEPICLVGRGEEDGGEPARLT